MILSPDKLWSRAEVLARPCPVPRESGLYGWYIREIPCGVPTSGCYEANGYKLLYVGISPKAPTRGGANPQRRLVEPAEIGALARYLCLDEAVGVTMQDLTVSGGSLW